MKLNLGCGFNKQDGFVNVDLQPACRPDQVVDLEALPWPWPDNSVTEVRAIHCLEHLGSTAGSWIGILRELWRVCAPGAIVRIVVPHPRHDNFIHDCTHVRVVTPVGLAMFDQQRNAQCIADGGAETKLGLFSGIDLEVTEVAYDLEEPWRSRSEKGEMTWNQVEKDMRQFNNVCSQIAMVIRIVKPVRFPDLSSRS